MNSIPSTYSSVGNNDTRNIGTTHRRQSACSTSSLEEIDIVSINTIGGIELAEQHQGLSSLPTSHSYKQKASFSKLHDNDTETDCTVDDDDGCSSVSFSDEDDDDNNNNKQQRTSAAELQATTTIPHQKQNTYNNFFWKDYWRVLLQYPGFRYYLFTDLCKNAGDWLVKIASLLIVQQWAGTGAALSDLVLSTLLPKAVFAPIGGMLADRFDRRQLMILLDTCAGFGVLGYLAAVHYQSLPILYTVTVLRSAFASAYYPVTMGIIPLLVPGNVHDLQYAVTMTGWSWGLMAMLGGPIAGAASTIIGLPACYVIDSSTYFVSALTMLLFVKGNYSVHSSDTEASIVATEGTTASESTIDKNDDVEEDGIIRYDDNDTTIIGSTKCSCLSSSLVQPIVGSVCTVYKYLVTCGFGLLVFMKATGSLIWGPEDIVGVEYATVRDPIDGTENEEESSRRMGYLFALIGFGCLIGPVVINLFADANEPRTLQRGCLISFMISLIGWCVISKSPSFGWFLVGSVVRTIGSGIIYPYSSLLLQALCHKKMLGRVLAVEYTMFVLAEALTSSVTGALFDYDYSKSDLALFGAAIALVALAFWGVYHCTGKGAANPKFNAKKNCEENRPDCHHHLSTIVDNKDGCNSPPFSSLEISIGSGDNNLC